MQLAAQEAGFAALTVDDRTELDVTNVPLRELGDSLADTLATSELYFHRQGGETHLVASADPR